MNSAQNLAGAAHGVTSALEALSDEDKYRVLESAARLFGLRVQREGNCAGAEYSAGAVNENDEAEPPSKGGKKKALVEIMMEADPATVAQCIVVFAYFRDRYEDKDRFARNDLVPYFEKAKRSKPANFRREFKGAVTAGFINDDGDNSYITQTGIDAVEAGFGGRRGPRRKKSVKKVKIPQESFFDSGAAEPDA